MVFVILEIKNKCVIARKGELMITLVYYFTNDEWGVKNMDIFDSYEDVNQFIQKWGPQIEVIEISER